jgi:hypothetical protein
LRLQDCLDDWSQVLCSSTLQTALSLWSIETVLAEEERGRVIEIFNLFILFTFIPYLLNMGIHKNGDEWRYAMIII